MSSHYVLSQSTSISFHLRFTPDNELSGTFFNAIIDSNLLRHSYINKDTGCFHFTCNNVSLLSEWDGKTSDHYNKLIYSLTTQMKYLEKRGISMVGFIPDEILVINNNIFIAINIRHAANLNNQSINWCSPIPLPHFVSPDLKQIKMLPAAVHSNAWMYSLGMLVLDKMGIDDTKNMAHSKLYSFVTRCMAEDPKKRTAIIY